MVTLFFVTAPDHVFYRNRSVREFALGNDAHFAEQPLLAVKFLYCRHPSCFERRQCGYGYRHVYHGRVIAKTQNGTFKMLGLALVQLKTLEYFFESQPKKCKQSFQRH